MNKFLRLSVLLAVILAFGSCRNERTAELYDDAQPQKLNIGFSVADFNHINLRTHMSAKDEARINEMAVWVFNERGIMDKFVGDITPNDILGLEVGQTDKTEGTPGTGVPDGATIKKGDITGKLNLYVKKGDVKHIVAIANYKSDGYVLVGKDGTQYKNAEDLKKIKDFNELKNIRVQYTNSADYATDARIGSLLLVANHLTTEEEISAKSVNLRLHPFDAKLTVTVSVPKESQIVSIQNLRYSIENIPTSPGMMTGMELPDYPDQADVNLSNPPYAMKKPQLTDEEMGYRNTRELRFTRVQSGDDESIYSYQVDNYLAPNDRTPRKLITNQDVKEIAKHKQNDNFRAYNAFDLRQKQIKNPDPNGGVINGDPEFAPKYATNIVLKASLRIKPNDGSPEKLAELDYRITLGDISDVPLMSDNAADYSDEQLAKLNNYLIESATHYTYNIKINGVENVIVEANTTKPDEEPNPSVEGMVINAAHHYQLDSHYEQRTLTLHARDFDLFKQGTLEFKPGAKFSFLLRTPFSPLNIYSFGPNEVDRLKDNKIPNCDNDWIRIYVNRPQSGIRWSEENVKPVLYSQTEDLKESDANDLSKYLEKTLTLEQFIYLFMKAPKSVFDDGEVMAVTIFFNEYFYEKNPLVKDAKIDNTLWKTFCNTPDRLFTILSGDIWKSPDKMTSYVESTVASFSQYSIITMFTDAEQGVDVWGVESIDEFPNLRWSQAPTSSSNLHGNEYYTNSWPNTWNLMAGENGVVLPNEGRGGGYLKSYKSNKLAKLKNYSMLSSKKSLNYYTTVSKAVFGKSGLELQPTDDALGKNFFQQAIYLPVLKNRDFNRDDKMQASELKWVIPSQLETFTLVAHNLLLPYYARLQAPELDAKAPRVATALYSSTGFGEGANLRQSQNPLVSLLGLYTLPLDDLKKTHYKDGTADNPVFDKMHTTTRLIRYLGKVDNVDDPKVRDEGDTYHFEDYYRLNELNVISKFVPNYERPSKNNNEWDCGGYFTAPKLQPDFLRFEMVRGELPQHNDQSYYAKLYAGGFRVASQFVQQNPNASNVRDRFGSPYIKLLEQVLRGNSPCKSYSEKTDKSDLGDWRLPTAMELALMGYTMTAPYWVGAVKRTDSAESGISATRVLWSATHASRGIRQAGDKDKAGWLIQQRADRTNIFLRISGLLRTMGTFDLSNNFGEIWANGEENIGWVRCVRDLYPGEENSK